MRVLVTDNMNGVLEPMLQMEGMEVELRAEISEEDLLNCIHEYEGLVVRTRIKVTKAIIDKGVKLQFIGRAGSGMENIEKEYAESKGIACFNSPEGNSNAVGNHSLALCLALLKKVVSGNEEVKNGIWDRNGNRGKELDHQKVGIIGFGHTGAAFARKLNGFECRVMAYDKYKSGFATNRIEESSLEDIQANADIISFHLPLNEETRYYFDEGFIEKCKKPVFIINTSRGGIVNTNALLKGLDEGKVLGAGLDVLENEDFMTYSEAEKQTFNSLKNSKQIILTPHIAGITNWSLTGMPGILAEKIIKWYRSRLD